MVAFRHPLDKKRICTNLLFANMMQTSKNGGVNLG